MPTRRLLGPILRDVSRSFYVSIRFLPRRLREPIGIAYLLARATDTLADTTQISAAVRMDALRTLSSAIQAGADSDTVVDLRESFAAKQTNESERTLIEVLPEVLQSFTQQNAADRGDIRELLSHITRGQMLDIERFGDSANITALATAADLRDYTYLVAGCVGEFWTRLCFRYIDNFTAKSENEMLALGEEYGRGLQLINVVRDAHVDLRHGRCYFPEEELQAAGLAPSQILRNPKTFQPIYQKWLGEAERGLERGMEYVQAINHFRVRAATVLPALIGARTLSILRAAGPTALQEKIKIPRKEVRSMIGTVALTLAQRDSLAAMFERYKK